MELGTPKVYIKDVSELEGEAFAKAYKAMTPERRAKIDRLKSEGDRKRSLGAGMLIEEIKSDFGISARVFEDKNGKPDFKGGGYHISISHSGDYAIAAVSHDIIGCDIEKLNRNNRQLISIARKHYSEAEKKLLGLCEPLGEGDEAETEALAKNETVTETCDETETKVGTGNQAEAKAGAKEEEILRIWVKKEAIAHLSGEGLKGLKGFDSCDEETYEFYYPEAPDGYFIAVVTYKEK
ncbi:MAG: hypothetical protein Q4B67_09560 [Eubacteriales bacterium]|nr:hypothetical protein [Eubacteriales bacterium]